MKVITGNRVPLKMWLEDIEDSAMAQACDLAMLPFAYHHVALMPDAHTGLGMPIGGVLATNGVVVPNAVGVDIGCGMCAIQTNIDISVFDRRELVSVANDIRNTIPFGFDHQKDPQPEELMPQGYDIESMPEVKGLYLAARHQLGTLGGGNHFIELQKDADNKLWIMIHSGSRNFGKEIAERYGKKAKQLCDWFYSDVTPGLEFLPIQIPTAKDYWNAMNYCVDFALCNRKLMMTRICEILEKHVPSITFEPMINIAHNYAAWEHHFGQDVIVHRKGATRARKGEIGIIPGSMGTSSFIVEGLGNPDSFESCSHGAGRVMGRRDACRRLDLKDQQHIMDSQNIVHFMKDARQLDEAPGAYKDIKTVMNNQTDLVRPIHQLWPIMVLKG